MPLPRLFLPFGTGIMVYLKYPEVFSASHLAIWPVVGFLLMFSVVFMNITAYGKGWYFGCSIFAALFFAGYWLAMQHNQYSRKDHFRHYQNQPGYLMVQSREPMAEKTNSHQVLADVLYFVNDDNQIRVEGRLILYLAKDSLPPAIDYGDRILINNNYNDVLPPQNPNAFNYKKYLARNNIYHSAYIQRERWHHTGENHGRKHLRLAFRLREQAMLIFQDNPLSERDFAVITALLLGYREYLDEDLRREFAGAGAMHILCVSGLHVGIIFMILKNIFSFFVRIRGGRHMRTLCIILCIWLYAAITGFSPSVLRASVMFSFVAAGHNFSRSANIYNTLAASAFVLVISNPMIITHIGFQLSYLAVISIVSLQPRLYAIISVKHPVLEKAWSVMTVSVAAQLATGPLALYYFNQFPNYFLITNLVVIPLAGIIIYASFLTLLLNPVPAAGLFMGYLLSAVLNCLHQSVRFIEALPYSTARGIYLTAPETILVFILLLFFFVYWIRGCRKSFLTALVVLVVLASSFTQRGIRNSMQRTFVVYSINQATAIDFIVGKTAYMLACDQVLHDPGLKTFHTDGNRLQKGVFRSNRIISLDDSVTRFSVHGFLRDRQFLAFNGYTLVLIGGEGFQKQYDASGLADISGKMPVHLSFPFEVDYLLITQNPRLEMDDIFRAFKPSVVILDASNSRWNADRMEEACLEAGVAVWNVRSRGAYQGGQAVSGQNRVSARVTNMGTSMVSNMP